MFDANARAARRDVEKRRQLHLREVRVHFIAAIE